MASVEDIYRKIRRGETPILKFSRPTDEEIAEGVERIRGRLVASTQKSSGTSIQPKRTLPHWIWGLSGAMAAMALLALLLLPAKKTTPGLGEFSPGSLSRFGTVEVLVLTAALLEHEFVNGKLSLYLRGGSIAVKRRSAQTELTITTPSGKLSATGTAFLMEHDKQTSIELSEGNIEWKTSQEIRLLDSQHRRLGRDLSVLHKLVPADFMRFPVSSKPLSETPKARAAHFGPKDCVIYTVNGVRRQGIIKEVVHGEFRITYEGIDEPDLFSGSGLIGCGRRAKP